MATTISSGTNPYKLGSPPDFGTLYSGRALEFDGVTDYVDTNFNASVVIGSGNAYTFSAWVYPSNDAGYIIWAVDGSNQIGMGLKGSGGVPYLYYAVTGGTNYGTTTAVMKNDVWQFCVVTYDGTTVRSYLDGVFYDDDTASSPTYPNLDSFIGARNVQGVSGASGFMDGKITNVQLWDKAWSLSDVQYAYTHPEKLITHNSAVTSGTTISNLKAWYPMTEGNPRSPQTTVYDGSEKGLGSELITNGDFSGADITSFTASTSNIETPVIEDGTLKIELTSTQGYTGITTGGSADGNIYKLTGRVKVGTATNIKIRSLGDFGTWADVTYTNTDWVSFTHYAVSSGANGRLKFELNGSSGQTGYLDDISIKLVKMGNHGTTKFYGTELWDSAASTFDSGTYNWSAVGSNTQANVSNELQITYDDSQFGSRVYLRDDEDMNTDLVIGRQYRLTIDAYFTGGSSGVVVTVYTDAFNDTSAIAENSGSKTNYTIDFTATHATNNVLELKGMGASNVVYLDNISCKEVGVAAGWTTADAEPLIPQTALMGMSKPILFDGVNDVVSCGTVSEITAPTASYSVWFNSSTIGEDDGILCNGTTGFHRVSIVFNQNGKLAFSGGGGASAYHIYSDSVMSTDTLYHVVCTRSLSGSYTTIKMYLNGALQADTDTSEYTQSTFVNTLFIGRLQPVLTRHFEGIINEVAIFTDELSLTQVQELFNDGAPFDLDGSTLTGSPTLTNYYRNTGTGTWSNLKNPGTDDGTPAGSPDTLLLPEGTTSGKDILGFPLTHTKLEKVLHLQIFLMAGGQLVDG